MFTQAPLVSPYTHSSILSHNLWESVCLHADYIDDTASKVIWCIVNMILSYNLWMISCSLHKFNFNSIQFYQCSQRLLHQFRRKVTLELMLKSLMIWQIYTIRDITMDVVERKLLIVWLRLEEDNSGYMPSITHHFPSRQTARSHHRRRYRSSIYLKNSCCVNGPWRLH